MALLHADNFSIYGPGLASTVFMKNGVYAAVDNTNSDLSGTVCAADPDGVSGGYVLRAAAGEGDGGVRFVLPSPQTTVGVACRMWCPSLPSSNYTPTAGANPGIQIIDSDNHKIAKVWADTNGYIRVTNYENTQLGMSTAPAITANGWYHIEAKFVFSGVSDTTVDVEVRVEGIPVLTCSGVTDSGIGTIYGGPAYGVHAGTIARGATGNTNYYVKDLVVWDGTGTQNNDFLGSVLVTDLTPDSDVALNWTPSTGADGYSILADIPPVDTKYISAATSAISPYVGTVSDLPVNVTSVKGLITYVRAAKLDGGDASLQNSLISSGNTADGANRPITVAQTYWRDVFELDPHTAAPWTVAAVNAVELQLNRTA